MSFALAQETDPDPIHDIIPVSSALWTELSDGFDVNLRILSFVTYQDVAGSTQNPDNDFLKLPRFMADMHLRPDVGLHFRRLDLSIKPRMNLQWKDWRDGTQKGRKDWEDDWFVNEWLARLMVTDTLFISYGRENLQWGPSYLFSPSNPFFADNGRINPKNEVPGMDFARLVWLPSMEWTVSIIANTDKGRQESQGEDFQKTYAVKLDYTMGQGYSGLILSHREKDRDRIGAFGGWTASDALLLYGDLGFSQGSNFLYPVEDAASPFGISMYSEDKTSSSWKGSIVVGGSYTFLAGPTLTVEYLYSEPGYNDEQVALYNGLKQKAALGYKGFLNSLSAMTLGLTADPGLRFLRSNYAMVQYRQNDIIDVLNLSVSCIRSLDDNSIRIIGNADYYIGDHIQVFTVGCINAGSRESEFRGFLDSYLLLGLEYTF